MPGGYKSCVVRQNIYIYYVYYIFKEDNRPKAIKLIVGQDLGWQQRGQLGGRKISPMHVSGVVFPLIFLYQSRIMFSGWILWPGPFLSNINVYIF